MIFFRHNREGIISLRKYFVAFLVVLFLAFLNVSYSEAATIRISTPRVELDLAPGETYSGEIIAENPEDQPIKAKIYVEDWIYAPGGTGEKKFSPVASTPLSASKWITFTPAEDTIKPFGRITARYTVTVPADAKGAYYSVLFFETILGTAKDEEGVNVLVAGRIGALFFVQVKGTVARQGKIQSVEIKNPEGNKPMEILTTFQNSGNVDVTLGGNFLVMDPQGKIRGRGDLNKIYTFPGSTESGKTQWVGRLPKGSYQLLLTYDLGKGKNLVEERSITIS